MSEFAIGMFVGIIIFATGSIFGAIACEKILDAYKKGLEDGKID